MGFFLGTHISRISPTACGAEQDSALATLSNCKGRPTTSVLGGSVSLGLGCQGSTEVTKFTLKIF